MQDQALDDEGFIWSQALQQIHHIWHWRIEDWRCLHFWRVTTKQVASCSNLEGGGTTVNKADVVNNQVSIYMQVGDILEGHANEFRVSC